MASFDDFFAPSGPKWENEGDAHQLVVTGEMKKVQETGDTGKPLFMVQESEGSKWQPFEEGDFDPKNVKNHFKVDKFQIPGTWEDGTEGRLDVRGREMSAFKKAWQEFGQDIIPGVTIGKRLHALDGTKRTWRFKMVAQDN